MSERLDSVFIPTGRELLEMLPDQNPSEPEPFKDSFVTADNAADFIVRGDPDDATVGLHVQVSSRGFGNASVYQRLSAADAVVLARLLQRAAAVARAASDMRNRERSDA